MNGISAYTDYLYYESMKSIDKERKAEGKPPATDYWPDQSPDRDKEGYLLS